MLLFYKSERFLEIININKTTVIRLSLNFELRSQYCIMTLKNLPASIGGSFDKEGLMASNKTFSFFFANASSINLSNIYG